MASAIRDTETNPEGTRQWILTFKMVRVTTINIHPEARSKSFFMLQALLIYVSDATFPISRLLSTTNRTYYLLFSSNNWYVSLGYQL
jgi:hypothetical protein